MADPIRPLRHRVRILAGILLLLCLALPGQALASGKFLVFSDLHFNPFADQALVAGLAASSACQWESILSGPGNAASGYGQETNYALFASTLADMRLVEPNPDFLIFTGDILAHNFNQTYQACTGDSSQAGVEAFISKTLSFFASEVAQNFPGISTYISLGNNDAYEGDYQIAARGSFLKDSGQIFAQYFLADQDQRAEFLTQYPTGGYYSLKPASGSGIRIISLNSVFFSVNRTASSDEDPGLTELNWLENQLMAAEAAGEKVLLLSHIPPGVNVYNTIHDSANSQNDLTTVSSFWDDAYTKRFTALMARYGGGIISIFSGHTHMDDFRLVDDHASSTGQTVAYVHITPAVSAQFGNNPAFQDFSYDPAGGTLLDYTAHFMDVGASQLLWRGEYAFRQAYGQTELSPATERWIFEAMAEDKNLHDSYTTYYKASNRVSPFKDSEFTAYWCGIANLDPAAYQTCYNCAVQRDAGASANFGSK